MNKLSTIIFCLAIAVQANAQSSKAKYRIAMDVTHGEKFWHDPAHMDGMDGDFINRVKYMTGEFVKSATAANGELVYLEKEITPAQLAKCNLVFIHIPSAQYTPAEVSALVQFIKQGGSLFLVMDSDYWSNLEQTNVNDIIKPFGIQFGGASPDSLAGGTAKVSSVTSKSLKISYHEARIVKGGTPFCFNNRSDEFPFGTYLKVKNGGKIIAMGEGMVSLYMTEWQGVKDYQCQEFMQAAFRWLLSDSSVR